MRIHHLNCISSCPLGGRLMDEGPEGILARGTLTCHCLLLETEAGLVLCDTGFGLRDVADPRSRLSLFFLALVSPDFREEMTARRQVERLGYSAEDVRHIVLTHLDFDHAGGLDDFPQATIHLIAQERDAARLQKTWLDRQRFRPQQWASMNRWRTYDAHSGESWNGFARVGPLDGLPPEILFVPLIGHTLGHAGIAIDRGDKWLFMAGDAYFFHREMDLGCPHCTPGLKFYQWMMDKDRGKRKHNQHRLRELKGHNAQDVELFCSHDTREFERLAGRRVYAPAGS
ncbi:MBL fold metallo-hydrolase [Pusillimonas sp.]|uniref:MBL fold metallo-hydrolase n=1 Tax=Pusillimonas sp. TaxID=3040095 RepID=UPI0029A116C5|nr:MBL fold metallo-hydrolase [Pusillimonas sp.]MDX3894651.1 MBL fold metallo-hydrolase [Pusillimonas sp.]